jgi:hypothetical protein
MEGWLSMTEEQVTKKILEWLINNNWDIISFDFPQSGTGKHLHPNKDLRQSGTKNKKSFIPDIVTIKDNIVLFFENKNRFFLDDFIKLNHIKKKHNYTESIDKLLVKYDIEKIYYGIGAIYNKSFIEQSKKYLNSVDFIVLVSSEIIIFKDSNNIFKLHSSV